jgi:O-glycosyl hydrolase
VSSDTGTHRGSPAQAITEEGAYRPRSRLAARHTSSAASRRTRAYSVGGLFALVCLVLSACSPGTQTLLARQFANGSADVAIDGAQRFQPIDGFGVNANSLPWDNGTLVPALAQLTDSMGASVWRVIVESTTGWEDTPDTSDPNTYDWSYYDQLYETPKFQSLWGVLGYLQQKRVPTIMLNVMGCPPAWMGDCAIDLANEDDYVKMEASLLYYAHSVKHVRIDIFSPMNEEDHGNPEGPSVTSSQYVRILDKLSARLDALGLGSIRLLGPDTASVGSATGDYMPALLGDAKAMGKIAHFGLHDYGGNAGNALSAIANSAYPSRTFWMTEYSAWCDGCDNGAPNPNDWNFAMRTLDDLFDFIEQGASSALVYDGYDSYYEHHASMGYWGLLGYDATNKVYVPRKRFYTVAQVVRFARPGMVRIGATSTDTSLRAFAFTDPTTGALTIVGHNASSTAETLHGALTHLGSINKLALYQTTPTEDLARAPDITVSSGVFTAEIAPDSVFTLTTLPSGPSSASATMPAAVPASTATAMVGSRVLGNATVGPQLDNGDANYMNGSRFTMGAEGGDVVSMSVHVGDVSPTPNNQYSLAIYADSSGRPGTLVAHSEHGILKPNTWNVLPVHATLRADTAYWLMYNTNGSGDAFNNMHTTTASSVVAAYSARAVPFGNWPSPFGDAIISPSAFSIYATYATNAADASPGSGAVVGPPWGLILGILLVVGGALAALYWLLVHPSLLARLSRRC